MGCNSQIAAFCTSNDTIGLKLSPVNATKNKRQKGNEIVHMFFHYYRKVTVFSYIGGGKE